MVNALRILCLLLALAPAARAACHRFEGDPEPPVSAGGEIRIVSPESLDLARAPAPEPARTRRIWGSLSSLAKAPDFINYH